MKNILYVLMFSVVACSMADGSSTPVPSQVVGGSSPQTPLNPILTGGVEQLGSVSGLTRYQNVSQIQSEVGVTVQQVQGIYLSSNVWKTTYVVIYNGTDTSTGKTYSHETIQEKALQYRITKKINTKDVNLIDRLGNKITDTQGFNEIYELTLNESSMWSSPIFGGTGTWERVRVQNTTPRYYLVKFDDTKLYRVIIKPQDKSYLVNNLDNPAIFVK